MTGFRGKLKLNYLKPRGELYLGDNMKKEYVLKLTCDDRDDICEVDEDFKEEEVVFTINDKDVICPNEMSRIILSLDNTILGLA